jgi:hypothetical protein
MRREEFLKPYMLLVIQTWGKHYALQTVEGQIQSEFYYEHFQWVNLHIWEAVCQTYAKGNHWPSIDELMGTIRAKTPQNNSRQLEGPPVPYDFLGRRLCTEKRAPGESLQASYVRRLGAWLLTADKDDPDTEAVQGLYDKAKGRFPVNCGCGQEHPACTPCGYCDSDSHRRNDAVVERPLSTAIRQSLVSNG